VSLIRISSIDSIAITNSGKLIEYHSGALPSSAAPKCRLESGAPIAGIDGIARLPDLTDKTRRICGFIFRAA
jgi:hypothetical protein